MCSCYFYEQVASLVCFFAEERPFAVALLDMLAIARAAHSTVWWYSSCSIGLQTERQR